MTQSRDREADDSVRPSSSSNSSRGQSSRNQPLVIVSERGRHSDESRRIVRAQAARASAWQSRQTRQRNREGRDGSVRDGPQSPNPGELSNAPQPSPSNEGTPLLPFGFTQPPLVSWLANLLNLSPSALMEQASSMPSITSPTMSGMANQISSSGASIGAAFSSAARAGQTAADSARQLPQVFPRGFIALQERIEISATIVSLVTRTNCFDFGSPGVEERLHRLLFDLIIGYIGNTLSSIPMSGHPIQGHLRIACTCLTIFQGQRANGQVFAHESKYQTGLEAAWSEATLLDQKALTEPKAAEASLWAVFIISVTTGATANFFHQLLQGLLQDLQLHVWPQVRSKLLEFIYPGSVLDEPCKVFYDSLQQVQMEVG